MTEYNIISFQKKWGGFTSVQAHEHMQKIGNYYRTGNSMVQEIFLQALSTWNHISLFSIKRA